MKMLNINWMDNGYRWWSDDFFLLHSLNEYSLDMLPAAIVREHSRIYNIYGELNDKIMGQTREFKRM